MRFLPSIPFLLLAVQSTEGSPIHDPQLEARNLSPAECFEVAAVVSVLGLNKATSFCSSLLGIKTVTSTAFTYEGLDRRQLERGY